MLGSLTGRLLVSMRSKRARLSDLMNLVLNFANILLLLIY